MHRRVAHARALPVAQPLSRSVPHVAAGAKTIHKTYAEGKSTFLDPNFNVDWAVRRSNRSNRCSRSNRSSRSSCNFNVEWVMRRRHLPPHTGASQVRTWWEGNRLITREQTPKFNNGQPIVCRSATPAVCATHEFACHLARLWYAVHLGSHACGCLLWAVDGESWRPNAL